MSNLLDVLQRNDYRENFFSIVGFGIIFAVILMAMVAFLSKKTFLALVWSITVATFMWFYNMTVISFGEIFGKKAGV